MISFTQTKTHFNPIGPIDKDQYSNLKRELLKNPQVNIDPNFETFTEHFIHLFIPPIVTVVLLVIGLAFDIDFLIIISMIGTIISIFCIIQLLLDGPSYATAAIKRKQYFEKLSNAIITSDSYEEFILLFQS